MSSIKRVKNLADQYYEDKFQHKRYIHASQQSLEDGTHTNDGSYSDRGHSAVEQKAPLEKQLSPAKQKQMRKERASLSYKLNSLL